MATNHARQFHHVPLGAALRFGLHLLSRAVSDPPGKRPPAERRPRTDLRLVPAAVLVWGTAIAGNWMPVAGLAGLCTGMATVSGLLLVRAWRVSAGRTRADPTIRSVHATLAVALLLSVATGAHSAVDASRRETGPIAGAVGARSAVVAELEVAGYPRKLSAHGTGGLSDRWAVPVTLRAMAFGGREVVGEARLTVMGGPVWGQAVPGQRLRAAGKLRPAAPGGPEAGILSASSVPAVLEGPGIWQAAAGGLRRKFTATAARFGGDAGGLLPGMVTGDTSSLDVDLEAAMKTVGMTHLTAVSGANCSLVLGALLLAARSLRLPRTAAAAACLAGLGLFVLMAGTDASVLRAALMGGIGLASVASGRAGRGLSLLCLAVIGLLLAQPALATSFGFLLSVLATLGIVVTGRQIMDWLPSRVPRWAAAGVAVPLSAQLFCGPVIVLLQPQFSTYALPANIAAAILVAPVTLLGTAAVALLPALPAAAEELMAAPAACAGAVARIARYFASLPGAVLPWPEGPFGAVTMGLFSAVVLTAVWIALHPSSAVGAALAAHARTLTLLESLPPDAGRGLEHRSGHGTLRVRKPISGRKHAWLLPRPNEPGPRRRRAPPGAM